MRLGSRAGHPLRPSMVGPIDDDPALGNPRAIAVPSVDQYQAEVENLTAAILDGAPPRLDLQFSRGTIAALVDLDRAARLNAGLPTD